MQVSKRIPNYTPTKVCKFVPQKQGYRTLHEELTQGENEAEEVKQEDEKIIFDPYESVEFESSPEDVKKSDDDPVFRTLLFPISSDFGEVDRATSSPKSFAYVRFINDDFRPKIGPIAGRFGKNRD